MQRKLTALAKKAGKQHRDSVIVGYTAKYALFIHENKQMKWEGLKRTGKRPDGSPRKGRYWDPQGRGQSQFLIQPFREKRKVLSTIIEKTFKATNSLTQGLVLAGLALLSLSQQLVPVDLGNLKGSAFTKVEKI